MVKHASRTRGIIGEVALKIPNGLRGFEFTWRVHFGVSEPKRHVLNPKPVEGMGINGFGRIGRLVFRAASGNPDAEARRVDARVDGR